MIAILLTIYQRHDLEEIVIDRLNEQKKKFGFEIIIIGSEGEKSKALAKGNHYIEVDNYPVSHKHQAGLDKARELNCEAYV